VQGQCAHISGELDANFRLTLTFFALSCILDSCTFLEAGQRAADGFSSCTPGTSPLKISSITVTPSKLIIGQNVTVTAMGTLATDITGGAASLSVMIQIGGQWTKLPTLGPVAACNDYTWECPLKAGPLTMSRTITIPSLTPPAKYQGQLTATDQTGGTFLCIKWNYQLYSQPLNEEDSEVDEGNEPDPHPHGVVDEEEDLLEFFNPIDG